MIGLLGTDATHRLGGLTIDGGSDVTLGTATMTAYLTTVRRRSARRRPPGTLTLNGTTDHSGVFTASSTGATALGNVVSGGNLTVSASAVSGGALSGGGVRTFTANGAGGAVALASLTGSGAVSLTAGAIGPITVGTLGSSNDRLGALTVDGGSGVTFGTMGAIGTTAFLTSASIGQNAAAPVAALTIYGGTDHSGTFTATTTGATTVGGFSSGALLALTGATGVTVTGALTSTSANAVVIANGGTGVSLAGATLGGSLSVTASASAATSSAPLSATAVDTLADSVAYGDVTATTAGGVTLFASNGALSVANVTALVGPAVLKKTGGTGDLTIAGTLSSAQNTVQSNTNILAFSIQGKTGAVGGNAIEATGRIDGVTAGTGVGLGGGFGGTQFLRAGNGITIAGKTGAVALDAQATTAGDVTVKNAIGATGDRTTTVRLVSDNANVTATDIFTSDDQTLIANTLTAGALDSNGSAATIALTGDAITVGAVNASGGTAKIVADRRASSVTGTSLTATRPVVWAGRIGRADIAIRDDHLVGVVGRRRDLIRNGTRQIAAALDAPRPLSEVRLLPCNDGGIIVALLSRRLNKIVFTLGAGEFDPAEAQFFLNALEAAQGQK